MNDELRQTLVELLPKFFEKSSMTGELRQSLQEILPKLLTARNDIQDEIQIESIDKVIDSILFLLQNY